MIELLNIYLSILRKLHIKYTFLSPNVITLVGVSFNFIFYFIGLYYCGWTGKDKIPSLAIHIMSLCYNIYYYIDNIDGKQARKLKASSPLGSLFDHCCDSMTTYLITSSIGSIVGCTELYQYVLLWFMAIFPFFAVLWEENLAGYFYLPPFNGVSEGSIITCIAIHIFGFFGNDFLDNYLIVLNYSIQYRNFIVISFFLIGSIFAILS